MPQYQGVWTLQQQAQAQSNQQWVTDPNFKNTTLLLQADGTGSGSQNQTFLDGSTNNFFITRNGNTTQGSFSPFSQAPGYWGNYFNRYALSIASVTAAGTGDFTYEGWIYPTVFDTLLNIWDHRSGTGHTSGMYFAVNSTGNILIYNVTPSTNAVLLNQWNHVAFVRSSGTLTYYINGVSGGSQSFTRNCTDTPFYIANGNDNPTSVSGFIGYISNMRYATSVVYTSNFNPNTSPLGITSGGQVPPTGTNTKVLGCQFNRFSYTDSAGAVQSFTVSGTPSVQAFGPFAPALQWTSDVVGGSGYFDGSGDYLYAGNNAAFTMSTGDFTYECWVYHTSTSGQQTYFARNTGNNNGVYFYKDTSNFPGVYYTSQVATSSVALTANQWYHLVVTRLSGTLRIFINGVQTASVANTTNLTESVCYVGADSDGSSPLVGYMASSRILKGTGYSSITIPTAPLTAITNTSLLLNYTNAGIYDGKMANNLETVGNAQVSTSVVKYGSGSMYFDGNGDYLFLPASQNTVFGTGDYTIEFWVNYASASGNYIFFDSRGTNIGQAGVAINIGGGNIAVNNGTSNIITATAPTANAWHHIALSRSGSSNKLFIDGIQAGSTATSSTNYSTGYVTGIGATLDPAYTASYYLNGYIDDLRITKGVARYIANFTPPQQALPRQ